MKRRNVWFLFVVPLSVLILVLTLAAQHNRTLTVIGYPGELAVVEMGGRPYVEVEALAHMLNASLGYQGDRTVMMLPSPGGNSPAAVPAGSTPAAVHAVSQPVASGFSKDFLKAGIEEMAAIREWRVALTNSVQRGFPITPDWVDNLSAAAQQSLRLTSLAASTESDRAAFQLLTNVFNNMKQLSDRFLQLSKSMTYIPPDSLKNDPLDQRILTCARSLASMAASNQFSDDGSCH